MNQRLLHLGSLVNFFLVRVVEKMIFLELHQNLLTTGEQVLVQDLRLSHTSEQLDHVKFLIQHLLPASKQTMVQVA